MYAAFEPYTGALLSTIEPPQGCNFQVILLIAERGKFIVKTGDADWKITELEKEAAVLTALAAYQPLVPFFLARVGDHFLFTYVEGRNLVSIRNALEESPLSDYSLTRCANLYGSGLRRIHDAFHPDLPRSENWLDDALLRCAHNLAEGIVSGTADEHSAHAGRPLSELLTYLQKERPHYRNELRFSHGDWCMPNVLAENREFAGVVDWSNGGYKDYRYDLATGLWSLRRNGLHGYEPHYLESYGYRDSVESLAFFEALYVLL